jgi:hypothetical protein
VGRTVAGERVEAENPINNDAQRAGCGEHDHKASSSRLTETRAKLAQMPAAQLGQALSDLSEVTSDLAQDFERPLNGDDQWLNV